jgi:hypothetical protein
MDRTIAIAGGWFLVGVLLTVLWETQTKPLRNEHKAKENAGKEVPFPSIREHVKQATG